MERQHCGAAIADDVGLVDEVVSDEVSDGEGESGLMARARELAETIAGMPPLAVAAAMDAVGRGADLALDEAMTLEAGIFGQLCGTEDKREGTQAFLEKRSAVWVGR